MATAKGGLTVAIKSTPQAQSDTLTLHEDQLNDRAQSLTNAADSTQNVLANDGGGAGVQIMGIVAGNAVEAVKADLAAYVNLDNFSTPKAAYTQATIGSGNLQGSVTLSNGGLTYVPAHDISFLSAGETAVVGTFTYIIRMGNGAFSVTSATITLVGDNDVPVARADVASVQEDSVFVGSVAANDYDVDHLDVLSFKLNSPIDGLAFNSNGSYTFDAGHASYQHLAAGQTATIVTSYMVSDGHGGTATSTLTITVTGTNDAPVAHVAASSGAEDGMITGAVHADDIDDGAVVTYAVSGHAPAGFTLEADGSYTLDATNAAYQHLAQGAQQDVVISYTATDEHGASSLSTITIHLTGVNDAPVAGADTAGVAEDTVIAGSVAGNDTDADDGAVLTFSTADDVAGLTFNADGSYSFDASHGSYQHLAAGQTMQVVANYTVTDEHGASSASTLTITVTGTNDAPVAHVATNSGTEDSTITGVVHADDVDDGAVLAYAVDGQAPAGFILNADGSYSFDATDGAYQHLAEGAQQDLVIGYTATDEHGASSLSTITIHLTGVNDAPVAVADTASAAEDTVITGSVAGNDTDADDGAVLSFSMTDDIAGLTFHADGSYSFDAGNAAYQSLNAGQTKDVVANYTVTDEHGATSASTLTITVQGANEAPPPAPEPTLHSATVEWSIDGKADPNGGHIDLLGGNWSNFHLSVNGMGDFDWKSEGFDLSGDASATYRGPQDHNSTGNSGPETQLNFSTGDVAASVDTSKLADGSFDYDVTLTNQTSDKSHVNLTFTYDYWA